MKKTGEEIYSLIPNRYPFMILDSLEVNENSAVSFINLKEDTWIFKCHYPGNPVLPLSLLVECMTQTFSATFLNPPNGEHIDEIPVISSISELRLKESLNPGDTIRLEAVLDSFRRGVAKGECKAFKNKGLEPIMEISIVEVLPSHMVVMR